MAETTTANLFTGLSAFIRLQLLSRLVTFVFNLLTLRKLRPEDNGLFIQFQLIATSLLFLSREGFRRGCMRAKQGAVAESQTAEVKRILGVSVLPIFVGGLVCTSGCAVIIKHAIDTGDEVYAQAVGLHGLAIFLELLSEPFYIVAHVWLRFSLKLWVEGTATFVRGLVTVLLLYSTEWEPEFVFSAAQITFAVFTLLGYSYLLPEIYSKVHRKTSQLYAWFDPAALQLSSSFCLQAVVKLVLAEGSKYIMVAIETRYNQGVFGLVNGLGSLVVRTILQPIEEAAFTAFSRSGVAKDNTKGMHELGQQLRMLLKFVSFVGFLAVVFGPQNSFTLLRILYSKTWSNTEAPTVLGWYCGYIFLLAVNGVTEAFVHAVLDAQRIAVSNVWMFGISIVHISLSILFTAGLGFTSIGLIIADSMGMAFRITYSLWCIRSYFSYNTQDLRTLFLSNGTLFAMVLASAFTWIFHMLTLNFELPFHIAASVDIVASAVGLLGLILVVRRTEAEVWQSIMGRKLAGKTD